MRHNKKFNHLSRKAPHREAMLANMSVSLIRHKRITTTLAKAKALRMYIEPLLTKAKNDTTHSRRVVFSHLQNKEAVAELFRDVAVKIADRPGGYTRILRTGYRLGDNAEMCIIELVDYNENMLQDKSTRRSRRRTRRSRKKSSGASAATAATDEVSKQDKKTEPKKAVKTDAKTETAKKEPTPKVKAEETPAQKEAPVEVEGKKAEPEEAKEAPVKAEKEKAETEKIKETAKEEKASEAPSAEEKSEE